MSEDSAEPMVMVAGDVTVDWNVADTSPASTTAAWSGEQHASISVQPGGACLLTRLAASTLHADVRAVPTGDVPRPDDRRFHHSSAVWVRFPAQRGSRQVVWRVNDYLGLTRRDEDLPFDVEWSLVRDDPEDAEVVLLDDGGLGFRDDPVRWPSVIREGNHSIPLVVLKTPDPFGRSALFHRLRELDPGRLVVVTSVGDVRCAGIEVSRGLSWEASAEDLARAVGARSELGALVGEADVVVSFGAAGALAARRRRGSADPAVTLVFDADEMEGTWEADRPGGMIGGTTCVTAGVATALASRSGADPLVEGIMRGLTGLRALHQAGFVAGGGGGTALEFPFDEVATAINGEMHAFAQTDVPSSQIRPERWSILRDRHVSAFDDLAAEIVRIGPDRALAGIPVGRFGALVTADRREIEGFRGIQNLIAEYCAMVRPPRPLSIAVFGPPGSGKSFAVTQVARSLQAGEVEKLTFNLSQLGGPDELIDAFHRVRDAGLSAQIPLVFWDEFDSTLDGEPLGWLRHFLAPMQDGEFRDGQLVHPIGRAIFVFAGGTVERLSDLGSDLASTDDERAARFRSVKGPDFLSRLRGTVEILGPDPATEEPSADPEHVVRRAIVLQSILTRTWPQLRTSGPDGQAILTIGSEMVRAFLGIRRYRHGVRSMESIVASSRLTGESSYHRSALPPPGQLRLHVDDAEFLGLARRISVDGALADELAARLHERFREAATTRGWGSVPAWEDMDAADRASSYASARDIPNKLAALGYEMVPATSEHDGMELAFTPEVVEQLARAEHDRWIAARVADGWTWGEEDATAHTDADLVPWDPMTQAERAERYPVDIRRYLGPGSLAGNDLAKDKDRLVVEAIPDLLAAAGLRIVPFRR